ncbi:hypothetical protein CHH78_12535 [Shouchella clausii]|nr:hypothetical protein CHH74_07045 [Shouchella clausii]PAD94142.1 hypothetical protein CHH52_00970 [Shouchella clausii]PAE81609.1 hypothetical protein CHH78_12535 [Shouchella clausii]PAF04884.1 hypothetical protein CHH66_12495 [Shouchella clausii]
MGKRMEFGSEYGVGENTRFLNTTIFIGKVKIENYFFENGFSSIFCFGFERAPICLFFAQHRVL